MVSPLPDDAPQPDEGNTRSHLRKVMVAWFFGAGWLALVSGTSWIRFSEHMGLKRYAFTWGLLAAMPFLATFAQLFGSYWIERTQRRKPLFLAANIAHRAWWFVIAALPFLFLQFPRLAIVSVLAMFLVQAVGAHAATPPWTSWMADIIPPRIRGRYFGLRARLSLIIFVSVSLLSGWMLDASKTGRIRLPWPDSWASWHLTTFAFPLSTLHLCAAFFSVAAVLGIIDILFFINIPDRPWRRLERPPGLREIFGPPLRDPRFTRFLLFYAVFWLGAPGIGNYIWIHALTDLRVTDLWAQIMFMVIPPVGEMLIAPTWGHMIDRFGRKTTWILSMSFPAILPACWIFVTPEYWWMGIGIQFLGNMFWSGAEQCNFNSLLRFASGSSGSSSYQAIFALTVAIAGAVSGGLFALLAYLTSGFHLRLGAFTFTYVSILFAVAAAIRLGAYVLLLPGVREEAGRKSVRSALGYMAASLYQTLRAIVLLPVRLIRWRR